MSPSLVMTAFSKALCALAPDVLEVAGAADGIIVEPPDRELIDEVAPVTDPRVGTPLR
jgi:hypothetical protein